MSAVLDPVTFDADTHTYRRGLQVLTSVTKVVRETWPVKPSWDGVDQAVIDNARDRGVEVDALFSGWINGTLRSIPAGTREDAKERFQALRAWWAGSQFTGLPCSAQVILADDEIAGQSDVIPGGWILDLKNTAAIESTYSMQLGGYADLYEKQHGRLPSGLGVIHVTQAKDKPVSVKLVQFEVMTAVSEWRLLRQFWGLVQRKSNGKRRTP
jgi:hypothetical protein